MISPGSGSMDRPIPCDCRSKHRAGHAARPEERPTASQRLPR